MPKVLLFLFSLFIFANPVLAQSPTGNIATSVSINSPDVLEGHIVSMSPEGTYSLSQVPFDSRMVGIVVQNPSISVQDTVIQNPNYIVNSGEVLVRVNGLGGSIQTGDYITSSAVTGVAQKANTSGHILGIALQEYSPPTPEADSLILVNVKISNQFISSSNRANLVQVIRSGLDAPASTPVDSLRYIIAGLVVTASFIIGFTSFGKTSGSSIDAMGRNPLAKNTIRSTVVFNFVLTGLIMFSGIFLAYLVLIL